MRAYTLTASVVALSRVPKLPRSSSSWQDASERFALVPVAPATPGRRAFDGLDLPARPAVLRQRELRGTCLRRQHERRRDARRDIARWFWMFITSSPVRHRWPASAASPSIIESMRSSARFSSLVFAARYSASTPCSSSAIIMPCSAASLISCIRAARIDVAQRGARGIASNDADLANGLDAHGTLAAALGDLAQAGEIAADRVRLHQSARGIRPVAELAQLFGRAHRRRACGSPRSLLPRSWHSAPPDTRPPCARRSSRPAALPASRRRRRRCRLPAGRRAPSDLRRCRCCEWLRRACRHPSSGPSAPGSPGLPANRSGSARTARAA